MEPFSSWIVLAVGSAVALSAYDVCKKLALEDNAVLPTLLTSTISGWLVLSLLLLLSGGAAHIGDTTPSFGLELAALPWVQHAQVFGKALIVSSSWVLSFFAVKHLPLSFTAPLRASAPLFTVTLAVLLLAERPSAQQWLGIAVTLLGYVGFAILARREGLRFEANRWVLLQVLATLLGASSGVYDKYLLQGASIPPTTLQFWFTSYNLVFQALLVLLLWWPRRAKSTPFALRRTVIAVGVILVFADQLYFHSLSDPEALVSVVSLVRRGSVVLTFGLGGWLLREAQLGRKSFPLAAVVLGIALMLWP